MLFVPLISYLLIQLDQTADFIGSCLSPLTSRCGLRQYPLSRPVILFPSCKDEHIIIESGASVCANISNCSMAANIPPNGVSFLHFICTFVTGSHTALVCAFVGFRTWFNHRCFLEHDGNARFCDCFCSISSKWDYQIVHILRRRE